jgi:hypothetical protein
MRTIELIVKVGNRSVDDAGDVVWDGDPILRGHILQPGVDIPWPMDELTGALNEMVARAEQDERAK